MLDPLAEIGHSIDTSGLHPNLLRHWVRQFVDSPHANLTLSFESFAFKDGIPVAADLVFDVRNLPNPHYDPELRPLTGRDEAVAAFLVAAPQVQEMINDIAGFIEKWLPSYVAEHRHYVTVAIGCTGGRHRSVYVVEELARRFQRREAVLVRHRGIEPLKSGAKTRQRMPSETLTRVALFPLSVVLFPQGVLPLRVFEARYMDMVRDCMRDETFVRRLPRLRRQGSERERRAGNCRCRLPRAHHGVGHATARPAADSHRRRRPLPLARERIATERPDDGRDRLDRGR